MNYTPIDPLHSLFLDEALTKHRSVLVEILVAAEALQEAVFATGAEGAELPIGVFERELGCGVEAAIVSAKIAGFIQAGDGRWYSKLEGDCPLLQPATGFIADQFKVYAETI
ncbi:hypothetical protein [uncultured Tateyamaria sp.]|uniref:hypothetical protein n=1 Tax=uncultured Tateyamaria sp. TaxID=455651 RepID=UPI0026354AA8|nr:hypothetical protein [uncultured Tateyamaria sp.]